MRGLVIILSSLVVAVLALIYESRVERTVILVRGRGLQLDIFAHGLAQVEWIGGLWYGKIWRRARRSRRSRPSGGASMGTPPGVHTRCAGCIGHSAASRRCRPPNRATRVKDHITVSGRRARWSRSANTRGGCGMNTECLQPQNSAWRFSGCPARSPPRAGGYVENAVPRTKARTGWRQRAAFRRFLPPAAAVSRESCPRCARNAWSMP